MTNDTRDNDVAAHVNETLGRIADSSRKLESLTAERQRLVEEAIKRIDQETGLTGLIDDYTAKLEFEVSQLCGFVAIHAREIFPPDSKKAVFRNGTIYVRTAPAKLVVDDEDAAIKSLRRLHKLRKFTRTTTKLVLTELKKHPDIVARMNGVRLEQNEFITVAPFNMEHELKRPWHPLRRNITKGWSTS